MTVRTNPGFASTKRALSGLGQQEGRTFSRASPYTTHQQRLFSKESSASELHSQVSQTLQPPKPPPPPTPAVVDPHQPRGVAQQIFRHADRRARYNQAMWNAAAAFMLMLMAAQSLKSSRERRRVAASLVDVQGESEERLRVLQSLLQEETIQALVQEMLQASESSTLEASSNSTKWWNGKSTVSATRTTDEQQQQQHLKLALWKKMAQLVADTALDEAEQETLRMRLQELERSFGSSSSKNTKAPEEATAASLETTTANAPKRVPFTM